MQGDTQRKSRTPQWPWAAILLGLMICAITILGDLHFVTMPWRITAIPDRIDGYRTIPLGYLGIAISAAGIACGTLLAGPSKYSKKVCYLCFAAAGFWLILFLYSVYGRPFYIRSPHFL